MATCKRCGKKIGFLAPKFFSEKYRGYLCAQCQQEEREKQKQIVEQKKKEAQRAYYSLQDEIVKNTVEKMLLKIDEGEKIFLYERVYISVDSQVMEKLLTQMFDIADLIEFGMEGWRMVGVVPKTIGVALTNITSGTYTQGETWGAGIGGNIAGVYILLEREVSKGRPASSSFLGEYVRRHVLDFATDEETIQLADLLGTITK